MKRVLKIYRNEGSRVLIVRTHSNYDDYRLSFRTDVWNDKAEDWELNHYITHKYGSEESMLQAFAELVNKCLFDGSKFDLNIQ